MQLSPNQKTFSEVFSAFPQSKYNLKYFEKKDEPQSYLFLKLYTAKSSAT